MGWLCPDTIASLPVGRWLVVFLVLLGFSPLGVLAALKDMCERKLAEGGQGVEKAGQVYVIIRPGRKLMNQYFCSMLCPLAVSSVAFMFLFLALCMSVTGGINIGALVAMHVFFVVFFLIVKNLYFLTVKQYTTGAHPTGIRFKRHGLLYTLGTSKKDRTKGTVIPTGRN